MAAYPIFLELNNRPCLVIGGGQIASRKAAVLLSCGARVKVISPALGSGLKRLVRLKRVRWIARRFRPADLGGIELAVAATDEQPANRQAVREAARRGIWINVVDQPKLCTFILPSVVRRGKLALAISTGGASPALAKWIRKDLQQRYGAEYGKIIAAMASARRKVQKKVPGASARKKLFEKALRAYLQVLNRYQVPKRSLVPGTE